jgi:hypothetical protein
MHLHSEFTILSPDVVSRAKLYLLRLHDCATERHFLAADVSVYVNKIVRVVAFEDVYLEGFDARFTIAAVEKRMGLIRYEQIIVGTIKVIAKTYSYPSLQVRFA